MSKPAKQQSDFEAEHHALGWFTGVYSDKADEVSAPHRHGPTHLLVLEGSVEFTLDGSDRRVLKAGDEIKIADGQLHATVAGSKGFRYAFACPKNEAVRQGLIKD